MKDKETVVAPNPDKRGRAQGINPGLGVEQPAFPSPFQENSLGACIECFVVTDQIPAGIFDIAAMG
jgi:hypothetical protein